MVTNDRMQVPIKIGTLHIDMAIDLATEEDKECVTYTLLPSASRLPTLALKLRRDISSPKHGYQWPLKKDLSPPKNFKKEEKET